LDLGSWILDLVTAETPHESTYKLTLVAMLPASLDLVTAETLHESTYKLTLVAMLPASLPLKCFVERAH
jgi:hypothetical protein